ncbi:MAG: transcription termination factor NusA [Flavobacteriales bacterium]|nr:transcription termination factor NusA [Flavobacteriales bacterium]MCX7649371.1 transcription termination factor NusA [Flavobacteriales bacterium]MDW8432756.1 transcription termination factor NusA [Flavobacteriales bacterium]
MAKRKVKTHEFDREQFKEALTELKDLKNVDRVNLINIIEETFRTVLAKKYGSADNFDIFFAPDRGDLEVYWNREIVEDGKVEDPNRQIEHSEAIKIEPDFEVGETLSQKIPLEEFGHRAVATLKQTLQGRVRDVEKDNIYKKYKDRVGEIITAEVYQIWKKELLLKDDEGHELVLPRDQMIPGDFYKKGDMVKAIVAKVEMKGSTPIITLSRTSPVFLERLFEAEIPEIEDGLISIRKIVRSPGERAKVAVETHDDRIDPVGACVGVKGTRIHGIVRELRNENIDVINFTHNMPLLIQRALSPAKITSIRLDEDNHRAEVFLKPDQVSLAIGKGGQNIRLASRLTGYEIDVYRDTDTEIEDVPLDEFRDEIDGWIIDQLKAIGLDTARAVLEIPKKELADRADLEEETAQYVLDVLAREFEEDAGDNKDDTESDEDDEGDDASFGEEE